MSPPFPLSSPKHVAKKVVGFRLVFRKISVLSRPRYDMYTFISSRVEISLSDQAIEILFAAETRRSA